MTNPTPRKVAINCPIACSLHPDKIGWDKANALAALRANGAGERVFTRRGSEIVGYPIPTSNVQRHLRHYVPIADDAPTSDDAQKKTDIEILDSIIVSGYRNSRSWKPTIRDTLDAMKLKMQMTGNSAFDDLIALFDTDIDDDVPLPENEEAVLSPEERSDEADEDLGEPLGGS